MMRITTHMPFLSRPAPAVCAGLAAIAVCAPVARAAELECAPQPDNPVGYQVTAVHADQVAPRSTTPPIAVLDSGVGNVPELKGRVRNGFNVTTGGRATGDSDGHGTEVA